MATIISVDQIGLCRRGSDIDLEAVYGGRISQRKPKGLKVNPVYTGADTATGKKVADGNSYTDHNGNMNSIHMETYENFPQVKERKLPQPSEISSSTNVQKATDLLTKNSDTGQSVVHVYPTGKRPDQHVYTSESLDTPEIAQSVKQNLVMESMNTQTNGDPTAMDDGVHNPAFSHSEDDTPLPRFNGDSIEKETVKQSTSPVKFLTEVHVHSVNTSSPQTQSDWPDLDDIVVVSDNAGATQVGDFDHSTGEEKSNASEQSSRSNQRIPANSSKHSVTQGSSSHSIETEPEGLVVIPVTNGENGMSAADASSERKQQDEDDETQNADGRKALSSSTRTLKSILASSVTGNSPTMERKRSKSQSDHSSHEKCVKFSDDTVFNEDKPKKYKKDKMDRINLREIYRGKISSDSALAKMNPLFDDEVEDERGKVSLTDDEKVAYRQALKSIMGKTDRKGGSLNYKERFLVLKTQGLQGPNGDVEHLPGGMDTPVYDRLITRTLAKQRRKLIVKWTLVILTVLIVTAVATILGVYLGNKDS